MRRAIPLVAAALLAGCTVGPDYKTPDVAVPGNYAELPAGRAQALLSVPAATEADMSRWWTQFGDSELDDLMTRALDANLDLQAAASRVREAREQGIVAGAAGLPQVNATALAAHIHSNSDPLGALGGGGPPGAAPSHGLDAKLYSLGFDATWEIDVFGGVRRGVEVAGANTEAARWALRDGQVTLTAEIATNYLSLRALQIRIALLQDEARRQSDTLAFIAAQRRAGFVTKLDVNQQSTLETTTRAQIPPLQAQAGAAEHAIATLLAEQPGVLANELDRTAPSPKVPQSIPVGLPSDLLRRRPDVREAERKLAAATADIGVAVADLYPKFDLLGGVSLASSHLSTLFSGNSLGEAGIGSVMWPIFHGGQIRANIKSKQEEAEQAYLAYRKAILAAMQDVEDALLRFDKDQQRVSSLERAAATARSSADIAFAQYRAGLTAYVNVLTAQSNDLAAQDQLEQGREALTTDLVSLYKALGGGWSMEGSATTPAPTAEPALKK